MQEQLALAFRIASINFQRDSIAQVEIFRHQFRRSVRETNSTQNYPRQLPHTPSANVYDSPNVSG